MLDDNKGEMELKIIDLESSITVPEGLDQVNWNVDNVENVENVAESWGSFPVIDLNSCT